MKTNENNTVYDTHDCESNCPRHGFFEIVSDLFLAVLIVLYFFADLGRKFLELDPIQKFVAVWIVGCGIMTGIGLYYLFLGLN